MEKESFYKHVFRWREGCRCKLWLSPCEVGGVDYLHETVQVVNLDTRESAWVRYDSVFCTGSEVPEGEEEGLSRILSMAFWDFIEEAGRGGADVKNWPTRIARGIAEISRRPITDITVRDAAGLTGKQLSRGTGISRKSLSSWKECLGRFGLGVGYR